MQKHVIANWWPGCCLLLVLSAGLLLPAMAADKMEAGKVAGKGGEGVVDGNANLSLAQLMSRWLTVAQPGDMHQHLESLVGDWQAHIRLWLPGADTPSEDSGARATYRWALDGHWLRQELSGQLFLQSFQGMGFTGYDNFREQFVTLWMDNASTAAKVSHGEFDAEQRRWVYHGEVDDPLSDRRAMQVRYELDIIDRDHHRFRAFEITGDGGERPLMQVDYSRISGSE